MSPSIVDYFKIVSQIVVYNDNNMIVIDKNLQDVLIAELENLTKDSHEMPAYSVALDNEVRTSITKGLWIELIFNNTIIHNEMPFDKLLIEVNANNQGFNLIRHHDNIYEGRCYYLSLNSSMEKLYNTIIKIIKK